MVSYRDDLKGSSWDWLVGDVPSRGRRVGKKKKSRWKFSVCDFSFRGKGKKRERGDWFAVRGAR